MKLGLKQVVFTLEERNSIVKLAQCGILLVHSGPQSSAVLAFAGGRADLHVKTVVGLHHGWARAN